jgi:phenylpyruvate tautomerase PptA (4-oxalocrotonate tautomerase family)
VPSVCPAPSAMRWPHRAGLLPDLGPEVRPDDRRRCLVAEAASLAFLSAQPSTLEAVARDELLTAVVEAVAAEFNLAADRVQVFFDEYDDARWFRAASDIDSSSAKA